MSRKGISFAAVRKMALANPDVEESTSYGASAFKVSGKMFACQPVHRTAEPGSLAIRIAIAQRDELLAADPATYYVTDHYVDYPIVLARLSRIHPDALADLLRQSARFVAGRGRSSARRRKPRKPATQ